MSKLEDFTGTTGMNAGASVYAKIIRTADIQTYPELSGIFLIAEEKFETGEWQETGAADTPAPEQELPEIFESIDMVLPPSVWAGNFDRA